MKIQYYDAPIGRLRLGTQGGCITEITVCDPAECLPEQEDAVFSLASRWLDEYFRGEEPDGKTIPLCLKGTQFQCRVWRLLLTIPYGEVRTYGQLAVEIAREMEKETMSAQAVGQAVGSNPIGILIPCHRVVGAKGKLTGYAWGLERKRWLLRHEGHQY